MPDLTHDDQEIVRKAIQCAHDNGLRIGRESAAEGVRLGIETATKAFAPVLDTIVKTFEKITDSNADTVRKAMSAFVDGSGGELVRPAGCIPKRRSKKRKKVLKGSFDMAPYGYCPECFAPGVVAERRLNGNAHCQNGHVYPRSEAEYASTQIDLTGGIRERLAEFSAQIADGDLIEDGRETGFHITAKFGLHYSDATMVSAVVADFGPINYYVSDFASFQNDEYDVLYARVESDDLYRLNAKLSELCCTTTHPTYTPHATVAYLKPGLADKYIRRFGGISLRGTADTLTFSSPSREETKIPLGGTPLGSVAKGVVESDDESDPDPMDALTQAVVEEVYAAREQGDEDAVQAVIERYRGMIDDPALLEGHAGGVVKKGWSESDHPRSKTGQFIAKDDLKEAQTNPEKAKELREKVRPEDADKLEAVISGEKNPGRTKRGEQRHQAGQRREKKAANLKRANEIADKIAGGEGTAEDHHELADHLEGLTLDQLGILRSKIATRSGGRKKADVVGRLRDALRTGQSQAAVQRETPKDHARLAMSGFQPNRHDVADANGEKVKAGTGYVRYEDGRSVGYSADDAERISSAVTPEGALARIDMHDAASKDEAVDPMLRDYHAELADQLRGHHEAAFGAKGKSTPPSTPSPELKPSHPSPDEKSVTRQAWAANQFRKRQGKPPVDHELKLVPLDSVKPSQHGEDYINDSSKELARKVAGGKRSDRHEDNDPIALDESGNIVDGNHRHAAATMNGEKAIWAIVPKQPSIAPRLGPPGGGENSNEGAAFAEKQKKEASPFKSESFDHEPGFYGSVHEAKIGDATVQYQMASNGNIELSSVRVPTKNRGKGEARRAVQELLAEADRRGLGVQLIASPLDSKTKLGKLVDFYKSLGFEVSGRGNPAGDPKMVRPKSEKAKVPSDDQLPGGQADNAPDAAFPADKLAEGQKHEGEHATDPALAKEIAKDHLAEDPAYYDKLAKVEGGSADSHRGTPNTTGDGGAKEPHEMTSEEWIAKYPGLSPSRVHGLRRAAVIEAADQGKVNREFFDEYPSAKPEWMQHDERHLSNLYDYQSHEHLIREYQRAKDAATDAAKSAGRGPIHSRPDREKRALAMFDDAEKINPSNMDADKGRMDAIRADGVRLAHKRDVQRALSAGKPVPPEVLADYPDLAEKYGPKPADAGKPPEPPAPASESKLQASGVPADPVAHIWDVFERSKTLRPDAVAAETAYMESLPLSTLRKMADKILIGARVRGKPKEMVIHGIRQAINDRGGMFRRVNQMEEADRKIDAKNAGDDKLDAEAGDVFGHLPRPKVASAPGSANDFSTYHLPETKKTQPSASQSDPLTPHIDRLAPLIEMGQNRVITTELAQKATAELEKMPQSQVVELANRLLPDGFTGKQKSDAIYAIRKQMLVRNKGLASADDWDNWNKDQVNEMPTVSEEDKARYREKHAAKTPAAQTATPAPSAATKPKSAPKPKSAVNESVVNEHAARLAPLAEKAASEPLSQEEVDAAVKSVEHLPKEELRALASKVSGIRPQDITSKDRALGEIRAKLTVHQRLVDSQKA